MGPNSLRHLDNSIESITDFKQLFDENKKYVFAMALSILKDYKLSEDVMQEVFIKLYLYMQHNEVTNIKAWLISVSRTTALDLYRKKKREITGIENQYLERLEYLEDPLEKMVLLKYLELLDREERQIVILKDISGMKHKEIAKIIEIPLGTVLWKYSKALKKLRKSLK